MNDSESMGDVLKAVAGLLRGYAQQHRDKHTPDGDAKALTNDAWAARCEASLERALTDAGAGDMRGLMDCVQAFHVIMGQPVLRLPTIPPAERVKLRWSLHSEEVEELHSAMDQGNLAEIADAIGDLIYVLLGTALEYGLPLPAVWQAIQRANMAKMDPVTGKVIKNDKGKVMKPPGWQPPNINAIIQAAIIEGEGTSS